jgi:hypothetical protein
MSTVGLEASVTPGAIREPAIPPPVGRLNGIAISQVADRYERRVALAIMSGDRRGRIA